MINFLLSNPALFVLGIIIGLAIWAVYEWFNPDLGESLKLEKQAKIIYHTHKH